MLLHQMAKVFSRIFIIKNWDMEKSLKEKYKKYSSEMKYVLFY